MRSPMLLLGINEFNPQLLEQYADWYNFPNINKMLAMQHSTTITDDKLERYGLDPWVQWVSIHTGQPSSSHRIEHLGSIFELKPHHKQIWEALGEKGISCGVWGSMNASRRESTNCLFFFPDPWTFTEDCHPSNLSGLMALPRYYAKNYLELSAAKVLSEGLRTLNCLYRPENISTSFRIFKNIVRGIFTNGLNSNLAFSNFDLLNTLLFIKYQQKYHTKFNILFLNSVAHLQHRYWTSTEKPVKEIKYCVQSLNTILGWIFDAFCDSPVIIMNAFKQVNSANKKEFLYRQIQPEKLLTDSGIKHQKNEQLMTNDSHIFFNSDTELNTALTTLQNASVNNDEIFDVSAIPNEKRLFLQFKLWHDIPEDSQLFINNRVLRFSDYFAKVTLRTGIHHPEGDIYSRGIKIPKKLYNHEISTHICQHYGLTND